MLIPAHGPIPADTASALTAALRRAQRLVDDPDGAVWYGARRVFAYALMIRNGSIVARQGRLHAAAEHVPVSPVSLDVPFPRTWPELAPQRTSVQACTSLMNKRVATQVARAVYRAWALRAGLRFRVASGDRD